MKSELADRLSMMLKMQPSNPWIASLPSAARSKTDFQTIEHANAENISKHKLKRCPLVWILCAFARLAKSNDFQWKLVRQETAFKHFAL